MFMVHALKDLADIHFFNAKKIVLVQDNLNTHTKASLYEAFPAAEARSARVGVRYGLNFAFYPLPRGRRFDTRGAGVAVNVIDSL